MRKPDGTAAALRRAFDKTFAEAPAQVTRSFEDLLVVRIGNDPFAIRLAETVGLFVDRKIVPIPSPVPELLGVAGLRGQITPVYDLGGLLGYRAGPSPLGIPSLAARSEDPWASRTLRWFVLTRGPHTVGLAFEVFEAHARIPQACCITDATGSTREHVRGAVQVGGSVHPIIQIPSVIETIARRACTSTSLPE